MTSIVKVAGCQAASISLFTESLYISIDLHLSAFPFTVDMGGPTWLIWVSCLPFEAAGDLYIRHKG